MPVELIPWIVLIPLLGFLINGLSGLLFPVYREQKAFIAWIATLAVAIPFVISVLFFMIMRSDSPALSASLYVWMDSGGLSVDIGYRLDQLSLVMTMVVTGVGALIHVYSVGYMYEDKGYWKFFSFLNLFIFAMLNLVLADNLLLLFLGWEGVGLCSYLLIGFWYRDMAKSNAAKKAFLYNRVGDFAFLIAMFMIFKITGSLRFDEVFSGLSLFAETEVFLIGLLVLAGTTGKSAQIPLFVWLPDAMAGPTPVSALIHAATMVTSGIYVISRMSPLFMMSAELMLFVAVIGAFSAIIAATIALTQYDIKSVLAYSTVSQLGFMFLALGSGAYIAAMFHVVTHAFFKACLFLGSGSVIHAMHHVEKGVRKEYPSLHFDVQDMRYMGGLRKYMPSTYRTFIIAAVAIAGIPPLAGFFSKDEILVMTFNAGTGTYGPVYFGLWLLGMITAFLTAFYMFRLTYGIFHGSFRLPQKMSQAKNAGSFLHESSPGMISVLWVLAMFSVIGGWVGIPNFVVATFTGTADVNLIAAWLDGVTVNRPLVLEKLVEWVLLSLSVGVAVAGVLMARNYYAQGHLEQSDATIRRRFGGSYRIWDRKYLFDEIYEESIIHPTLWFSDRFLSVFDMKIVDGTVNMVAAIVRFCGGVVRYLQNGVVQTYAYGIVLGAVLVLSMMLLR